MSRLQVYCAAVLLVLGFVLVSEGKSCAVDQLKAEIQDISVTEYRVRFKVANQGQEGVCVLKWNTMLEDTFWASSVAVFEGDKLLEYAKPVIPIRQEIKDLDYAFIDVGEVSSIIVTRDLSDMFSFTSGKKYFLQIETKPGDCYTAFKATDCKARPARLQEHLKYSTPTKASVEVDFTASVTKSAVAEAFTDWLKRNAPERRNVDDSIVAFGTSEAVSEERFNTLLAAHSDASLYLELASGYLKPFELKHLPLFMDWFGQYSQPNYITVRDNFIETYEDTKEPHVYNFLPDSLCRDKWLAHVDSVLLGKKQHVINICTTNFFDGSVSERERAITVAHEMTHESSATQDQRLKDKDCYGADNCKELARSHPELAIWSAESYALFAVDVYDQRPSDKKRKIRPPVRPGGNKKSKKGPDMSSVQDSGRVASLLRAILKHAVVD